MNENLKFLLSNKFVDLTEWLVLGLQERYASDFFVQSSLNFDHVWDNPADEQWDSV